MESTGPDFHHVTLLVNNVRDGLIARGEQQRIKAVVIVKLTPEMAKSMVDKLQKHLDNHFEGMDVISLTLDGEFT